MIDKILTLLQSIDQETASFCRTTGLSCKPGCGACCENPHIETTVTELLPLAQWLLKEKKADDVLAKARHWPANSPCLFFNQDVSGSGKGSCSVYMYRPGICRHFGFTARKNSQGKKELVTCKIIKAMDPDKVKKTQALLDQDAVSPLISEHTYQVMAIDPTLGKELLPMNMAVIKAIEKIGLTEQFSPTEKS